MSSLKDRVSSRTRNIMENVMKDDCESRASSSKLIKKTHKEREDSKQHDIANVHKEINITNEVHADVEFNRCKVQTEINEVKTQSTITSIENIAQDNDTSTKLLLEKGLRKGADEVAEEVELLGSETVVYTVQSIDDLAKGNYTPVDMNDASQYNIFETAIEETYCNTLLSQNYSITTDIETSSFQVFEELVNFEDQDIFEITLNNSDVAAKDDGHEDNDNDNNEDKNDGNRNASEDYCNGNEDNDEISDFNPNDSAKDDGDKDNDNGNNEDINYGNHNESEDYGNGNEDNDDSSDFNPNDESTAGTKRKRHKKRTPECWVKNQIKVARMTGVSYLGYSREKNIELQKYDVKKGIRRKERQLGPRCTSKLCNASKIRKCTSFMEDKRQQIFKKFWELSWEEKAMMVSGLVSINKPKQKTLKTDGSKSRRSATYIYHLNLENDRVPVCKKLFLSTLGLNEWMVHNWVKIHSEDFSLLDEEINSSLEENLDNPTTATRKKRRKSMKENRPEDERMVCLRRFFEELPKVPSHYCRRSTSKQYLETNLESKVNLYRLYVQHMKAEGKPHYSTYVFDNVFDELNLSIFQPRKDRCDVCFAYESKNLDTETWEKHITDKDRSRLEKEMDKEKAVAKEIHCLTMDLQAVKCVPNITASESYYKTKLACHNFTVYNLGSHHCCNYWWNESEGDLSASVFASLITDYLENNCLQPKVPIVIFSDGCGYQNRNATLANALQKFSKDNDVVVTQKYLSKGHTQMECDSVHATIENKIKGKQIFVPFEYVQYTLSARKNPRPYEAKYVTHDFFTDFTVLNGLKTIRPGVDAFDPKVVDLKALKYTPNDEVFFKLDFDSEFEKLPAREVRQARVKRSSQVFEGPLPKLFKSRLPIKLKKWNDLQSLKSVVPADFHTFFDNLPKQLVANSRCENLKKCSEEVKKRKSKD